MSNFNGFLTILKKEIVDNLRDRRTLITIAISIIVAPVLLMGIIWFGEKTVKEETDLVTAEAFGLPVVGADYAPNLMNWLRQNNVEILDPPADPEAAVRSGEHRVVMVVDERFPELFTSGKSAPVRLIRDSSISGLDQLGLGTVQRALGSYSAQIGSLRLMSRGINPEVIRPIQVNMSDVASPEARNAQLVSMLPYLIIIFIMTGGMYLAIDTTAGEREKGSLESLLTLPVSRTQILLAKLAATAFFSALTLAFVLIGLAISIDYAPVDAFNFAASPSKLLIIFSNCLSFVALGSALLILVSSFTKSYKEAQSYSGFLIMLPSLPLMFLMFMSPEPSISNMWIPSLSHALVIIETLKGEAIPTSLMMLSSACSLLAAAALTWAAVSFYKRERILG